MFKSICLLGAVLFLGTPVAVAQNSSETDFREFLNSWVGHWRAEAPEEQWRAEPSGDGKTQIIHAVCQIASQGRSLVCHTFEGEFSGVWFVTYDARNKKIITQWSRSDGEAARSEVFKDGGKWKLKGEGSTGDGKKLVYDHTVTIEDDGNTHVWEYKTTEDGTTRTLRTTWHRIHPKS